MDFLSKHCVHCEGGTLPLKEDDAKNMLREISEWELIDGGKKIHREFKFADFKEAMKFVNKIAECAEHEGHHPDIHIFYNRVMIELWTHAVGGLSENDFIVAAKINELCEGGK